MWWRSTFSKLAGRRGDGIALMWILPIHPPLLVIFYGFGKLFSRLPYFPGAEAGGACPGDGRGTDKPSRSFSMPEGAGVGAGDGGRGQLGAADGTTWLQIPGCGIALLGGKGGGKGARGADSLGKIMERISGSWKSDASSLGLR